MAHNRVVMNMREDKGITRDCHHSGLSTDLLDMPFVAFKVNKGRELDTIKFVLDGNAAGVSFGKFDCGT
jgi:hypothetical protein